MSRRSFARFSNPSHPFPSKRPPRYIRTSQLNNIPYSCFALTATACFVFFFFFFPYFLFLFVRVYHPSSVRFTASSSLSPLLLSTSPTFPSHSLPKYIDTVQLTNSYFFFSFLSFLLVSQRRQQKEEARERATVPPQKLQDLFTHVSSSPLHARPFARDPPPWVDRMPWCP